MGLDWESWPVQAQWGLLKAPHKHIWVQARRQPASHLSFRLVLGLVLVLLPVALCLLPGGTLIAPPFAFSLLSFSASFGIAFALVSIVPIGPLSFATACPAFASNATRAA